MFLLYFLVWIIFNGTLTVEIAIFGVVIAALIFAFMCKFMDYSIAKEISLYKKAFLLAQYAVVLIAEIAKANWAVMKLVLTKREVVEPIIVKFKTDLKTESAKVLLANSITLTPGTITVTQKGDEFEVHCLDKSMSEGMDSSVFVRLLHKIEGKEE